MDSVPRVALRRIRHETRPVPSCTRIFNWWQRRVKGEEGVLDSVDFADLDAAARAQFERACRAAGGVDALMGIPSEGDDEDESSADEPDGFRLALRIDAPASSVFVKGTYLDKQRNLSYTWNNLCNDARAHAFIWRKLVGRQQRPPSVHVALMLATRASIDKEGTGYYYMFLEDAGERDMVDHLLVRAIPLVGDGEDEAMALHLSALFFQLWWTITALAAVDLIDSDRHLGNVGVPDCTDPRLRDMAWAYVHSAGPAYVLPPAAHHNAFIRLFDFDSLFNVPGSYALPVDRNLAVYRALRQTVAYANGKGCTGPYHVPLTAMEIRERIHHVRFNLRALMGTGRVFADGEKWRRTQHVIETLVEYVTKADGLAAPAPHAWLELPVFKQFRVAPESLAASTMHRMCVLGTWPTS